MPAALGTRIFAEGEGITAAQLETIRPILQFAFASQPGDETYTWTTVSEKLESFTFRRGKQTDLDRIEAGRGRIIAADELRWFDSENFDGPFYPNVKPVRPIRISIQLGGVVYPLLTHHMDGLPRVRSGPGFARCQISTVDAFEALASAKLAGQSYVQEATGTRIGNVLDDISQPAAGRVLSAGDSEVAATTFADTDTTSALAHIQQCTDDEEGLFFIDGSGNRVFLSRSDLTSPPYSVSVATFSDKPDESAGEWPYADPVRAYGSDRVVNEWYGQISGGTTQSASDAASQADYWPRSESVTSILPTDGDLLSRLQYKLSLTKDPLHRFDRITVKPGTDFDLWLVLLGLDIGERITVVEHPPGWDLPGGGAVSEADYTILGLEVTHPGKSLAATRWELSLGLAVAGAGFVFDTDVFNTGTFGY